MGRVQGGIAGVVGRGASVQKRRAHELYQGRLRSARQLGRNKLKGAGYFFSDKGRGLMENIIKGIVITPMDVYDKEGNLVRIEGIDSTGKAVIDAVWDPNDKQTNENRIKFRTWAYKMLNRMGYEVRI